MNYKWGQLLSISIVIWPHHSFIAIALRIIGQKKDTSLWALCLCQMILQFGEVEGGILFYHLLEIGFLRVSWVVIHYLPSLARYFRKGVFSSHLHLADSKKNWSNLPKSILNWVWALLCESLSILTCVIQLGKAMGGSASLAYGLTSLSVKYCNPTMNLGKYSFTQ